MHSLSLESGRRRWRLLVHGLLPGKTHRLTPKVCWAQLLHFGKGKPGPVAGGDCSSPVWHCTDRRGRVFGCRHRQLLPSTFCSCKSQMIPVQCGGSFLQGHLQGEGRVLSIQVQICLGELALWRQEHHAGGWQRRSLLSHHLPFPCRTQRSMSKTESRNICVPV